MNTLLCVLFLFCSSVVRGPEAPAESGQVARFYSVIAPAKIFIAHNTLDGRYFSELDPGEMVRYYDGERWQDYRVSKTIVAQAEEPDSLSTRLRVGERWLVPLEVHLTLFNDPDSVVLMTCVYRDGLWNWGRLFVIAEEVDK